MSRFDQCPNVRSVLAALLGADPTWDVTDQQHTLIDDAADRIGQILLRRERSPEPHVQPLP